MSVTLQSKDTSAAESIDQQAGTQPTKPGVPDAEAEDGDHDDANRATCDKPYTSIRLCAPSSPFRAVDWRWRLADHPLLNRRRLRNRWLDDWVRRVIKFKKRLNRPQSRSRRAKLDVALIESHRIRHDPNSTLRDEIEFRLIAGQTPQDIAARCGVAADVVDAYEKVFFNVIERLDSWVYIACIIDPTMSLIIGEPTLEVVLKGLANAWGPLAVDTLLTIRDLHWPPTRQRESRPAPNPQIVLAVEMLMHVLAIPNNATGLPMLLRLFSVFKELDRREASHSAVPGSMAIEVDREPVARLLEHGVPVELNVATAEGAEVVPMILNLNDAVRDESRAAGHARPGRVAGM